MASRCLSPRFCDCGSSPKNAKNCQSQAGGAAASARGHRRSHPRSCGPPSLWARRVSAQAARWAGLWQGGQCGMR
eukprot:6215799-Prymnesium_polylepis.1